MKKGELGKWGEDEAAAYLRKRGYKILDRNFKREISRFLKSEVDIVAEKKGVICFTEVKALSGEGFISPEEHVTKGKLRKVAKTGESWLVKNRVALDSPWQVDVVSIVKRPGKEAIIRHFKNVASWE